VQATQKSERRTSCCWQETDWCSTQMLLVRILQPCLPFLGPVDNDGSMSIGVATNIPRLVFSHMPTYLKPAHANQGLHACRHLRCPESSQGQHLPICQNGERLYTKQCFTTPGINATLKVGYLKQYVTPAMAKIKHRGEEISGGQCSLDVMGHCNEGA